MHRSRLARQHSSSRILTITFILTALTPRLIQSFLQPLNRPLKIAFSLRMSTLSNSPVHHLSEKVLPKDYIKARTRILTHPSMPISKNDGKVYYWVQRDMRGEDNWALLLAAHFSNSKNMPLRAKPTLRILFLRKDSLGIHKCF